MTAKVPLILRPYIDDYCSCVCVCVCVFQCLSFLCGWSQGDLRLSFQRGYRRRIRGGVASGVTDGARGQRLGLQAKVTQLFHSLHPHHAKWMTKNMQGDL